MNDTPCARRALALTLVSLLALACDDERIVTIVPLTAAKDVVVARPAITGAPSSPAPQPAGAPLARAPTTTELTPNIGSIGGAQRGGGSGKRRAKGRQAGALAEVGFGMAFSGGGGYGMGAGAYGAMAPPSYSMSTEAAPLDPPAPATGGTFRHAGTNPLVHTREDALSTFGIDVDTGSWRYARRFLKMGRAPDPSSVRVEEWVNALHYDYASPTGDAFAIAVDAAPSPFTRWHHVVRVALQGRRVPTDARKPAHVTFLVDVSGSMDADDKLPWARDAILTSIDAMRSDDTVAIATYAGDTRLALAATKATDKDAIRAAVRTLQSGGGTNMGSGMELAYREANKHLGSERSARVIVLSDGDANIGRTGHAQILTSIAGYVSEGVTMSTVGFGTGNYNDHLMEQLADTGNGTYTYIGDRETLQRVFADELTQTLEVIAQDAKIQVEWNPATVATYRLLGYENRDIADADFRNDKKDAGEIGAGHAVTAMYEVRLVDPTRPPDAPLGTVRVRHKIPRHTKAAETSRAMDASLVSDGRLDANAQAALGMALAAEILRGSEHARGLTLMDAATLLRASAVGPHAAERLEAAALIDKAPVRAVAAR
jgi:Ca-activated chloride channel family protein